MRMSLFLLFFFTAIKVSATDYYVSGSANASDSYTATQAQNQSTPWKTISRVNAATFGVNDRILF